MFGTLYYVLAIEIIQNIQLDRLLGMNSKAFDQPLAAAHNLQLKWSRSAESTRGLGAESARVCEQCIWKVNGKPKQS